ncbi:ribosomal protein S25 [Globomyces pollinis-pini]|nr:ribosomal protein S25 [Globomyces pollinis-pini]KAJ3000745.1 40S ribosomal protein S25 [Globomyces sp. JEL0801]KAJ3000778.1 40S ribosomal protein S25 [Globomyces sp. JEL0801]
MGAAPKKKWSKGRVKDKANNAVVFDKTTYERLFKEVPTYKLVSPSILVDRLRINGSLARAAIKELVAQGIIRPVLLHGSQTIYTRATKAEDEEVAEE